jgi:hypothetical protein
MVNDIAQRAPFRNSPEITAPASFDYGALDPDLATALACLEGWGFLKGRVS